MTRRFTLALVAALLLAACGNNTETVQDFGFVRAGLAQIAARRAAQAPVPQGFVQTRAQINANPNPLLEAAVPKRSARTVLVEIARNGPLRTFSTADATTLTLRDGQLVATRGLGPDVMSARVPPLERILAGAGMTERSLVVLDGNDQPLPGTYRCTLTTLGPERIVIAELSFATRHLAEACTGDGPAFTNHYWVESGGKIRQSRQWAGASVGYLELFLLKD